MADDTIIDIYCHIFPDKFFREMNRIAPRLGNIAARLRGVKKLFDLDERFREMDQFGDYREIISLPNPPIEDLAAGETGLNLARIGN
ncbi:MAG: amidohydrolase, partial [Alphaproteobacteria bacterium]